MIKEVLYEYLGTNGTILSPVHLEDIYYIRKFKLRADDGKQLTAEEAQQAVDLLKIINIFLKLLLFQKQNQKNGKKYNWSKLIIRFTQFQNYRRERF